MASFVKKRPTNVVEEDDKAIPTYFTRGEAAAAEARAQSKSAYKPEFYLLEDESAEVIVLDNECFNIWLHQLQVRGKPRKFTCRRKNCPLCRINEPRVVSVYRVIDMRVFIPEDKKKARLVDKFGFKQKYWEVGPRLQPTLAKLMEKGRLYKKVIEVSRTGAGTATTYQIVPMGEIEDDLRAELVKRGLLKLQLNFEEDYAPKSIDDLKIAMELFGGVEDDDDRYTSKRNRREEPPTSKRRSYLEDADEDDDDAGDGDVEDED